MKAGLPFLKKCFNILKDKDYDEQMTRFCQDKLKFCTDDQILKTFHEAAIEALREGKKTIAEIIQQALDLSKIEDRRNKLKSLSEEDRKKYFVERVFKELDKPPRWYEILSVTECKHCNFRYFFHSHYSTDHRWSIRRVYSLKRLRDSRTNPKDRLD